MTFNYPEWRIECPTCGWVQYYEITIQSQIILNPPKHNDCGKKTILKSPYHENGVLQHALIAEKLLKENHFITNNDGLYYYNEKEKHWELEENTNIVNHLIEKKIGLLRNNNTTLEVIGDIKAKTHQPKLQFNPLHIIPLENGFIDLKKMYQNETYNPILEELKPEIYNTYTLPYPYDPLKGPDKLIEYLSWAYADNPSNIITLLEAWAYTLTPNYKIRKIIFLVGGGDNGKSTLTAILRKIQGEQNCINYTIQELSTPNFLIANLKNKKLNITTESPIHPFDVNKLKALTGGSDSISARVKFQQEEESFENVAKLVFSCNQLPQASNADKSWFGRLIIIQHNISVEEEKKDKDLVEKLTGVEDLSGFFNLLLAFNYLVNKIGSIYYPHTLEEVKKIWEVKSNPLSQFISENFVEDIEGMIEKSDFYKMYKKFANDKFNRKESIVLEEENVLFRKLQSSEFGFWTTRKTVEISEDNKKRVNFLCGLRLLSDEEKHEKTEKLSVKSSSNDDEVLKIHVNKIFELFKSCQGYQGYLEIIRRIVKLRNNIEKYNNIENNINLPVVYPSYNFAPSLTSLAEEVRQKPKNLSSLIVEIFEHFTPDNPIFLQNDGSRWGILHSISSLQSFKKSDIDSVMSNFEQQGFILEVKSGWWVWKGQKFQP